MSSLAGGTWWIPFGGYYSSYDKDAINHANVIEYSWSKSGYTGNWWFYQKGCIAHDVNNDNIYRFMDASFRFQDSAKAGWNE